MFAISELFRLEANSKILNSKLNKTGYNLSFL